MPSPPRKKLKSGSNNGEIRRRLLAKPKTKPEQPFKTTGDDLVLRELTYYKDKMETNDEVHESIELCPVTKSLVDTEVYQRLRHINQLGNAQFIYTCANHNRFQVSCCCCCCCCCCCLFAVCGLRFVLYFAFFSAVYD